MSEPSDNAPDGNATNKDSIQIGDSGSHASRGDIANPLSQSDAIEMSAVQEIYAAKPQPEKLPKPSVWPVTLALGVTLLSFGIVTHWIMSLVGFSLFLLAAGGWVGDLRND